MAVGVPSTSNLSAGSLVKLAAGCVEYSSSVPLFDVASMKPTSTPADTGPGLTSMMATSDVHFGVSLAVKSLSALTAALYTSKLSRVDLRRYQMRSPGTGAAPP